MNDVDLSADLMMIPDAELGALVKAYFVEAMFDGLVSMKNPAADRALFRDFVEKRALLKDY